MQFDPILPPARVKAMTAQGYWHGLIATDYFDRCLAEVPDKTAVVDFNSTAQTENPWKWRSRWPAFFLDAVSMNHREKVQSLQANSGLYAVRS